MADLVLARACGSGSERAWERFIALYREPLLRAGIAITGNESLGRELADGLYAELYGLTLRDGERRCPLDSYSGSGSLMAGSAPRWHNATSIATGALTANNPGRNRRLPGRGGGRATSEDRMRQICPLAGGGRPGSFELEGPEDKFLLASYYLDGRKLHEIAAVLGVHEATVSRKLKRVASALQKQIVRGLERRGMSRREAEEAAENRPPGSDGGGSANWAMPPDLGTT